MNTDKEINNLNNIIKQLKQENNKIIEENNDLKNKIKELEDKIKEYEEEKFLKEQKVKIYNMITLYDIICNYFNDEDQLKEDFDDIFYETVFNTLKPLFLDKYKEIILNEDFYNYIKNIKFNDDFEFINMNDIRQILYDINIFDILNNDKKEIENFINDNREYFNVLNYSHDCDDYDCITYIYNHLIPFIIKNKIIENNIKIKKYIDENYINILDNHICYTFITDKILNYINENKINIKVHKFLKKFIKTDLYKQFCINIKTNNINILNDKQLLNYIDSFKK